MRILDLALCVWLYFFHYHWTTESYSNLGQTWTSAPACSSNMRQPQSQVRLLRVMKRKALAATQKNGPSCAWARLRSTRSEHAVCHYWIIKSSSFYNYRLLRGQKWKKGPWQLEGCQLSRSQRSLGNLNSQLVPLGQFRVFIRLDIKHSQENQQTSEEPQAVLATMLEDALCASTQASAQLPGCCSLTDFPCTLGQMTPQFIPTDTKAAAAAQG